MRVLRPGGSGWLYLIENPGGYFWDLVEVLRVIMRNEDRGAARTALQSVGIPANRIFYMLDHVMVPINVRLTPGQIEDTLREAGCRPPPPVARRGLRPRRSDPPRRPARGREIRRRRKPLRVFQSLNQRRGTSHNAFAQHVRDAPRTTLALQ